MNTNRFQFLQRMSGAATAAALAGQIRPAIASNPIAQTGSPLASHALVLSGGGARGAYEAGIACALAERAGIRDGQPLLPYGVLCGTSIGALNAWFIATGQYSALRRAWSTVASDHIIELKKPYAALGRPHQFIGERVIAAIKLMAALATHERAVAQGDTLSRWMTKHVDPTTPLLTPMIWAVTNLTTQAPEYFYRLPSSFGTSVPAGIAQAMRLTLGDTVAIRNIPDALLLQALLASTAMPLIFDPVELPMVDGNPGIYVDGSVSNDAAVSIAHTVAEHVHVIFVEAPAAQTTYRNASAIALGIYNTMQREILERAMREVYVQSLMAATLKRLTPAVALDRVAASDQTLTLLDDLPVSQLSYIRPEQPLPVEMTSFDEQALIDQAFALGEAAAAGGFTPYDAGTFR